MAMISDFGSGDGVTYMLTGDKHACLLVVSLMTLRRHYSGPVCLICGDRESLCYADRISASERLVGNKLEIVTWKAPVGGGKGLQHGNKANVFDLSPFDRTVFLDADTTVHGKINELLPQANTEEIRLTQFADWVSNGTRIKKRLEQYRELLPSEVAVMNAAAYPALNTGTFGFTKRSKRYFAELKRVCKALPVFMCDELAAQLIFVNFPHVVLDDRWNWSPVYSKRAALDARIVHYHGAGHCRLNKGCGASIWTLEFLEAWAQDLAGIREWAPAGDRHLRKWMESVKLKG